MPSLINTDSEYTFVPPHAGNIWPKILTPLIRNVRRSRYCINEVEVRGAGKARELIRSGDGVLLTPNHCRMSDALVVHELSHALSQPFYTMASSHLFRGNKTLRFILRRMGAFSVYREGVDRQAVNLATDILAEARRPLVIFPEGALSYANERLNALMEGVSFIARTAARKVARQEGSTRKVWVLPVAIRYSFHGDIESTVEPILQEVEQRMTWRTGCRESVVERIYHIGNGLMALKEVELFGSPQPGEFAERLEGLINCLLKPLEEEWRDGATTDSVINRVKELRKVVVPDMIESGDKPSLPAEELARRNRQLEDMALAQMLSLFPKQYLASRPTADRILETVERMAETLSGKEQAHGPMKAIVQVGEPLQVSEKRDRSATSDPVLSHIEANLNEMLTKLGEDSPLYDEGANS